jgi:hypothetical protein
MNTGSWQDSLEPFRRMGRSWGWMLLFGLVTLALGIVITFRPGGTVRVPAGIPDPQGRRPLMAVPGTPAGGRRRVTTPGAR